MAVLWQDSTRTNPVTLILSTTLQNLGADTGILSTAVTENQTSLDLYMDAELELALATAPTSTGGVNVDLRLVRTVDETNYEDSSGTTPFPTHGYVGSFIFSATTARHRLIIPQIMVPSFDFHSYLFNDTTALFENTTTPTLRGRFYRQQVTSG